MKIGVLGVQGGVTEHIYMLNKCFKELGINGQVVIVKHVDELEDLSGLIIPGGESTTIGILMKKLGILTKLRYKIIEEKLPVMGICAGTILLARKITNNQKIVKDQPRLSTMNILVARNYYGRQRESFEVDIKIPILGTKPFRCVFIRAPAIIEAWPPARPIAKLDNEIILVEQENMLAATFHPELTSDARLHKYFLTNIVQKYL